MTAVPNWETDDPRTDAELVCGSMAGDKAAFAEIYDRYADRLHDFCVGMLRDFHGAADCVQETFCIAATRLHQLREPDKLRPWLYSVARNEALRRLREQRRETPSDDLPDVPADGAGPDALSARTELADLISEAAGGLSDRDRALLELTLRHGMDGAELAEALGVSHGNANVMVHRLRKTVERSLGALLVSRRARNAPGACAELREILAGWDGQFTVLVRKRVSRHVESCQTCDDERRRLVSPAALLGAAPIFVPAPPGLREKTLGDVQLTCHGSAIDGAIDGGPNARSRRRARVLLAAALIAVFAAAGLLLASTNPPPISITPADDTVPLPAKQTPAPSNPTPRSADPPSPTAPVLPLAPAPPPANVAPPVFVPTYQAPPPEEAPPEDRSSPSRVPPPSKPPMSFSPTVIATPPGSPPGGGGGGGGGSGTLGGPP